MSDLAKIILSSAGFSAVFSWAIIWLFKSWISERLKNAIRHEYEEKIKAIEHEYAQKLQKYSTELRHQSELTLKEFEAKVSERNIKLTRVFARQADTVVKTYQMLVKQNMAIYQMIIMKGSKRLTPEEIENVNMLRREFYEYFSLNKIYLPQDTAKRITELEQTQNLQHLRFTLCVEALPNSPERSNEQLAIYDKLNKDIPELLRLLEEDLQRILGFPIPEKARPETISGGN